MGQRMTKCVFCVLCNFVFFFTMNTRIFSLNNCVFLYFLTPRCRRAKGNNFLLGLSFGKRVVRPKQHRGNPLCILRVFVFFLKIWGHTTNILHVFLCFLFIKFFFGHKSDRGKHLMCFVCFCVFSYRSQVTRPMCFMCFCVFPQRF